MLCLGAIARKESTMERSYESAVSLVCRATGPLSQHLTPYVDSLIRQQYMPAVVYVKAMHALSFDGWLARAGIAPSDVAEVHVTHFGRRRRRCRGGIRPQTRHRERFDVLHLLRYLRAIGACPDVAYIASPAVDLATAYQCHLRQQQGLADSSIARYGRVVQQFLAERFGDAEVELRAVQAGDVVEFVRRQAQRLRPPATKCIVNAMRSFLRYAQFRGDVTPELVAAVPAVATWTTMPDLPKAIASEHAQRAIDSCDLGTAIGLRDRAVLLILARLGLRAREIIALQLDDCDWDRGQLRVSGKGGRVGVLPMPVDVGEAIAAYLERGRPRCEDRHLFLRSTAPVRGLQPGGDGVGSIVRYALERANVDAPHRGSHQFRHALAVRLLRGGASLPEIGEVLRHRSPQSTSIYARVDLEALRPLALRWPGGTP
jgi:site-specific recombinase XerD